MKLHVVCHPLVDDVLAGLRDRRTPPAEFRRLAHRVSLLVAAEATRDLPTTDAEVETPLETAKARVLGRRVVAVPVLRAGLGMLDAFLQLVKTETHRGLEGRALGGFWTGGRVYGYRTEIEPNPPDPEHPRKVPRIEPAEGSTTSEAPPFAVTDADFRKLVAILRLAVPYTGLILSTRERPEIRREAFHLGISQISAGSRTNPGGYGDDEGGGAQFSLGDHRSLDEVVRDLAESGFIPSFCTSCYRMGRTGADFMDLARPGEIRRHCDPNALSTLQEFVEDHAGPATREAARALVARSLADMDPSARTRAEAMVARVAHGERDVFC